jgi:hypothetical protein
MGQSKHTPGPWRVESPFGEPGLFVAAPSSALVCRLYPVDDRYVRDQKESIEANARLIAAAPELLEALRPLADIELDNATVTVLGAGFTSLVRNARAAIAKAEGADL